MTCYWTLNRVHYSNSCSYFCGPFYASRAAQIEDCFEHHRSPPSSSILRAHLRQCYRLPPRRPRCLPRPNSASSDRNCCRRLLESVASFRLLKESAPSPYEYHQMVYYQCRARQPIQDPDQPSRRNILPKNVSRKSTLSIRSRHP